MRAEVHLSVICCCLLFSCNNRNTNENSVKHQNAPMEQTGATAGDIGIAQKTFAGSWYWKTKDSNSSFKIILDQKNDSVYGQYCAAYNRGNRMDCDFDTSYNIFGKKNTDNIASVDFNSFYGAKKGKAQLTLKGDTLIWEIKKFPQGGDCFAPERADLTHNNKGW